MLKAVGSGAILLASMGYMFSKETEFSEHKKQLEEFAMLLSFLRNEICLLRLPLEPALEHCAMHVHNPYQDLCIRMGEELGQRQGSAPELWRGFLAGNRREFLLDDE